MQDQYKHHNHRHSPRLGGGEGALQRTWPASWVFVTRSFLVDEEGEGTTACEGSVCRPRNLGLGGVQGRVPGREEEEAGRGRGHIAGSLMCWAKVTLIL